MCAFIRHSQGENTAKIETKTDRWTDTAV